LSRFLLHRVQHSLTETGAVVFVVFLDFKSYFIVFYFCLDPFHCLAPGQCFLMFDIKDALRLWCSVDFEKAFDLVNWLKMMEICLAFLVASNIPEKRTEYCFALFCDYGFVFMVHRWPRLAEFLSDIALHLRSPISRWRLRTPKRTLNPLFLLLLRRVLSGQNSMHALLCWIIALLNIWWMRIQICSFNYQFLQRYKIMH